MTTKRAVVTDLTQAAERGSLDRAYGRDRETLAIAAVLGRRTPKSVLLTGPPGVGKSRIIAEFAIAGTEGRTEGLLDQYRVVQLDTNLSMLSPAQADEKVRSLIDFMRKEPRTILAVDDIDALLLPFADEARKSEPAAALVQAIVRREIACLGATSDAGHQRIIESFPAFERSFDVVRVEPMRPTSALGVLTAMRESIQKHHRLTITDDALREAVVASEQFSADDAFPGKAIDLLDRTCAHKRLRTVSERELPEDLADLSIHDASPVISANEVRREAERNSSRWVPLVQLPADWSELQRTLPRQFEFQADAVAKLVQTIAEHAPLLDRLRRPKAVVFIEGSADAGQKRIVSAVASTIFGADAALHTVSARGLEGTGVAPQLSQKSMPGVPPGRTLRPVGALYFEDLEKDDSRLRAILVQAIETGSIREEGQSPVDCSHLIIVISSLRARSGKSKDGQTRQHSLESSLERILGGPSSRLVDVTIEFRPIEPAEFRDIAHTRVKQLRRELKPKDIGVAVDDVVYDFVVQRALAKENSLDRLLDNTDRLMIDPIREIVRIKRFRPQTVLQILCENNRVVIRAHEPGRASG